MRLLFCQFRSFLTLLLLICAIGNVQASFGQQFTFVKPQSNNELVQNSAVRITQDKNGYIWIATLAGLHKYDGYQYTNLHKDQWDNVPEAPRLWSIFIDSKGFLWAGSLHGEVYRINKQNGQLEDLTLQLNPKHFDSNQDKTKQGFGDTVFKFFEDEKGDVWIGSQRGLAKYFYATGKVSLNPELKFTQNKKWNLVTDIVKAHNGQIWFGHSEGLTLLNPKTGSIRNYQHDPQDENTLSGNDISTILTDGGYVWVGTVEHGLSRLNLTSDSFTRFRHDPSTPHSLGDDQINDILRDSQQRLWIATNGSGVNLFDDKSQTFTQYKKTTNSTNGLANNNVLSIFEDKTGIIWLGTNGGGINQINPNNSRFQSLKRIPYAPNSLSDDFIWDIAQGENDSVWLATLSGLDKFNRKTGKITNYRPNIGSFNETDGLNINAVQADYKGNIWLGLTNGDYLHFNPDNESFKFITHPDLKSSTAGNRVWMIIKDTQQGLILSSFSGTFYLNKSEQQALIDGTLTRPRKIFSRQARSYLVDYFGNIWLGTVANGLYAFDSEWNQLAHFTHLPSAPDSISNNTVRSLYQDKQQRLWVGTISGLNYLESDDVKHLNGRFKHFTTQDGLSNNTIYGILPDNRNNLWLSTNKGLSRFTPITKEFTNYDRRDGLVTNEFNGGAELLLNDGSMMFGGVEGLVYFHPKDIKSNPNQPKTVLTDFRVNNVTWPNPYSLETLQTIELSHTKSNIELSFAAMDYGQPLKNQFRYRMMPFEKEWIYLENERTVKYPSLRDGEYTFQVQGSNNDGLWSKEIRSLNLKIAPPWWRHPFAYICYLVAFLCLFALHNKRQSDKLKEEQRLNSELERVNRLKDEFLANTSHELRTPLNGIIGLSESLLSSKKNDLSQMVLQSLRMIKTSGERLANLVDNILDMTRLKQDKLELQFAHIDLFEEIESVIQQLMPLLKGKPIELTNNIEPNLLTVYADPQRLSQVLHNLITNAIKFTKKGSIVISAYLDNELVNVCVADTGIGIKEKRLKQIFEDFTQADGSNTRDTGGVGLGLSICKQLIQMHKGQIWVNSTYGEGSQFYFSLPVGVRELIEKPELNEVSESTEEAIEVDSLSSNSAHDDASEAPLILVVDDEPVNRMVLRSHLKKKEYQVDIAEDGIIALEKIAETKYDLIVLDVMMPRMTGIEVCRKLRKDYSLTNLPILMVSAKTQKEDIAEGINAGANDYITKPIEALEFYARVSSLLELRELEQIRQERDQAKDLAKANQQLALHYAQIDQVTLIPNRSSLIETFPKMLREAKLTNHSLFLSLISLDRFKQINESYGHLLGDRILHHLAHQISALAKTDNGFAARIGSDEFAMIIPIYETGIERTMQIEETANQLLALINHPIHFEDPSITVKASIGISLFPEHGESQMDLLRMADLAMIAAKKLGGNQAQCYSKDKTKDLRNNLNMENKIRYGLEHNEFKVFVQPLVEAYSKNMCSAEALLRWEHKDGMIFPDRFIPVAENCGLIIDVGKRVLELVCEQQQKWIESGFEPCPVAINVSMFQITRSNFVETLQQVLYKYKLPVQYIEVEVTESAMTENMEQFKAVLLELKQLGIKIAIDDFGTGFSSLSYLKELPVDKLKVDRSFITDITQSKQSRNIVASVIKLAHELNLEVVSEGVEDDLALQLLRNMGCDTIQGYLIARPFPLNELDTWFTDGSSNQQVASTD